MLVNIEIISQLKLVKMILVILCLSVAFGFNREIGRVNPDCPDLDLMDSCSYLCSEEFYNCVNICHNDSNCISECNRTDYQCHEACPCANGPCYNGCDGCQNPICFCQDFQEDPNYQKCLRQVGEIQMECLIGCQNMNNDFLTECEIECVLQTKNNYAYCPCQVPEVYTIIVYKL